MFGRPGLDASQERAQRAAAQRRAMVKSYWNEQRFQKNQLVQSCLCGAKKFRATADRGSAREYYCPNRHRPDHQPGAVYGRPLLVYRPDAEKLGSG